VFYILFSFHYTSMLNMLHFALSPSEFQQSSLWSNVLLKAHFFVAGLKDLRGFVCYMISRACFGGWTKLRLYMHVICMYVCMRMLWEARLFCGDQHNVHAL
jgi:hypothetical protein